MSAVSERHVRPLFRPLLPPTLPESTRRRRWWRYGLALALGGYLLFAHGCHGDEDNELWARLRAVVGLHR